MGPARGCECSKSSPRRRGLNKRIKALGSAIAELPEEHGNPLADLHGAGTHLAQAGDARHFRYSGVFAWYCAAAPIPCGYLARKTAEGKTPRQSLRALKRHPANML